MSEVVRESLKSAVKGTALVFVGTIISIGVWFVTKILIVRHVTKEELGMYSLAVAIVSIIALIAGAGLQDGTTRYISMFLAEGRKKQALGIARSAILIGISTGVFSSLGVYFFAGFAANDLFYMPEFAPVLKAAAAFCFFFVYTNVLVGIIRGYGDIRPRVYFLNIGQPVFFLIFLGLSFLAGLPFIGIIYSYVLAIAFSWACVAFYGLLKQEASPFPASGATHGKELLRFSIPLLATAVMGMVFNWTDTLMLGRYTNAEDVGIYNISVSLVRLLTFAPGAAGFVFMPIAGDLYAKGKSAELKRIFQVLTKWVFIITLPVFFVLLFFPEMTITFLFGERFLDATFPLQILLIGFIINVFVGVNTMMLVVLGRSKALMNVSLIGTFLNIILNYILIKRFGMGMTGAALATSISFIAISMIYALILYKLSGVQPLTWKYIRPLFGAGVMAMAIYALAKSFPLHMWMMPLYLLFFVVGYGAAILLTRSVDDEDVELVEAVARRTGVSLNGIIAFLRRYVH